MRSSVNEPFLVFRPSLPQLIPNLPRTAQVIYPKDIGPILIWADLFPGARVVEAGVGAGALSMALLRAIGSDGQLISYELREDFSEMAQQNVSRYFGPSPNWTIKLGDVATDLEETDIDRVVLDLPEPWHVIERAWRVLRPGGILLCYLPTVLQVKNLVDALARRQTFCLHRDQRKLDALLALQRHERPAATPHGRPHRFSHLSQTTCRRPKRHSPSPVIRRLSSSFMCRVGGATGQSPLPPTTRNSKPLLTNSPFAATTRRFRCAGRTTPWKSPWRT